MKFTGYESARDFVLRNARLLDRRLFFYLFEDGSREEVLAALRAYQNSDGGFGSGLEPDKRTSSSQPTDVEIAFTVLDWIDGFDDPLVQSACDFLDSITTPQGGLPFAVKGVESAPRTPWWQASDPPQPSINPTGGLAGALLKHRVNHPWVQRVSSFLRKEIEASETCEYHDVVEIVPFLQYMPDRDWAENQLERLRSRLSSAATIALDPNASGYAKFPIDFAPTPSSLLRSLFSDETIRIHLEALAGRQQGDGGWPINWQTVGPGAEMEWRGWCTVGAIRTLKAYKY